jgi:hypothetical protein
MNGALPQKRSKIPVASWIDPELDHFSIGINTFRKLIAYREGKMPLRGTLARFEETPLTSRARIRLFGCYAMSES